MQYFGAKGAEARGVLAMQAGGFAAVMRDEHCAGMADAALHLCRAMLAAGTDSARSVVVRYADQIIAVRADAAEVAP